MGMILHFGVAAYWCLWPPWVTRFVQSVVVYLNTLVQPFQRFVNFKLTKIFFSCRKFIHTLNPHLPYWCYNCLFYPFRSTLYGLNYIYTTSRAVGLLVFYWWKELSYGDYLRCFMYVKILFICNTWTCTTCTIRRSLTEIYTVSYFPLCVGQNQKLLHVYSLSIVVKENSSYWCSLWRTMTDCWWQLGVMILVS